MPNTFLPLTMPRPALAEPLPTLLDRTVIMQLHNELGESTPGLVLELIDLFIADGPATIQVLSHALADNQLLLMQRTAHTLKSTSLQLGAHLLATHCGRLEAWTSTEHVAERGTHMQQIQLVYTQTEHALQVMRAELEG